MSENDSSISLPKLDRRANTSRPDSPALSFCVLLLPGFSLTAFSLFLDPVRRVAEKYSGVSWHLATMTGGFGAALCSLDKIKTYIGRARAHDLSSETLFPVNWDEANEQPIFWNGAVRSLIVRNAIRFMEHRLEDGLSIWNVALAVNVSRRHLERLFKKDLGISPSRALSKLRLRKASSLVIQTDLSMIEIGGMCGYSNPSHFAASFRREMGMSPSQHRKAETSS